MSPLNCQNAHDPIEQKEQNMSLLERIKATIFGEAPPPPPRAVEGDNVDVWTAMRRAADGDRSNVSTPADDPVMDEVAAAGVQPISKPVDIEEAQNPKRWPTDRLN
jgi:hypothetical protein